MRLLLWMVLGTFACVAAKDNIVCYFSSWARYRPDYGMFDVDNIDPFLCTHIIFSFTGLSNHTWEIEVLDPWNELCPDEPGGHFCAFNRTVALKKQNPELTVVVAVGGWNELSEDYSMMAEDPQKRKLFIDSAVKLIHKYGFDGLDFDWEYPGLRGGQSYDKENFVTLIQEIRTEFDKSSPPLLLSGAFAAGKPTIDEAYDVPALIDLFDMFHIMAYDYHGAFDNYTHHNAPLCPYYLDYEYPDFNVMFTIDYYISLGVPKEKMVLGAATYGRCFTLDNIEEHDMLAPAHNPGSSGPYIQLPGTLGFNEICERIRDDPTCTIVHDPNLHEPYFYCTSDKIWCGYDDDESLRLKAKTAKNKGLGGMMVWQIDTDDFVPRCYEEPFHLIHTLKEAFAEPAGVEVVVCDSPTTPAQSTTSITTDYPTTKILTTAPATTPEPTTTDIAEPSTTPITTSITSNTPEVTTTGKITTVPFQTTTEGDYGRPDCTGHDDGETFRHFDCNKYWECANGEAILMPCGPGTLFDESLHICNYEEAVDTSTCRMWLCEVDDTYYPAVDCNQYYRCYNGAGHLETCKDDLYWNQKIIQCDFPEAVDTSRCNIP